MFRYKTGLYLRQSKKGEDTPDQSIDNQRKLLLEYVEDKPEFQVVEIYEDIKSGANYLRPQFLHMISDLNSGKINCIIVKDLSRLGRNYLETGEHLEQIFPSRCVRFISVNDNFDTDNYTNSQATVIALKNILNDLQLRVLSENVRKITQIKRSRGDYPSGPGPYGYKRSTETPAQLVIDVNTAPVVKEIFELKLSGKNQKEIARILTDRSIPTPSACLSKTEDCSRAWNHTSIHGILTNPYYTGNCVNGRYKRDKMNEKGRKTTPEYSDEWEITHNTHEAIIDVETFQLVQQMLEHSSRKWHEKYGTCGTKDSVFPDIVLCGQCGSPMKRKKLYKHDKTPVYRFYCSHETNAASNCTNESIAETDLEEMTSAAIKYYIRFCRRSSKMKSGDSVTELKKELTKRKSEKIQLYEQFKKDALSKSDYIDHKNVLEHRISELEKLIAQGGKAQTLVQSTNPVPAGQLTSEIIASLIMKIVIENENRVTIVFFPVSGQTESLETHWSMVRQPMQM